MTATRRYASDHRLAPRDEARLCIIIEELITNLIEHGGGIEQPVSIGLARSGAAVIVTIEDGGPPFDPSEPFDEADIPPRGGAAGLRLVRDWSDIIAYESAGGRNRLELSVPLTTD